MKRSIPFLYVHIEEGIKGKHEIMINWESWKCFMFEGEENPCTHIKVARGQSGVNDEHWRRCLDELMSDNRYINVILIGHGWEKNIGRVIMSAQVTRVCHYRLGNCYNYVTNHLGFFERF